MPLCEASQAASIDLLARLAIHLGRNSAENIHTCCAAHYKSCQPASGIWLMLLGGDLGRAPHPREPSKDCSNSRREHSSVTRELSWLCCNLHDSLRTSPLITAHAHYKKKKKKKKVLFVMSSCFELLAYFSVLSRINTRRTLHRW